MAVTTEGNFATAGVATATTDTFTAFAPLDVRPWRSVAYTVVAASTGLVWTIHAANASDYSDEILLQTATVAPGTPGSFATGIGAYGYFRTKIKSAATGASGVTTATIAGIAKR